MMTFEVMITECYTRINTQGTESQISHLSGIWRSLKQYTMSWELKIFIDIKVKSWNFIYYTYLLHQSSPKTGLIAQSLFFLYILVEPHILLTTVLVSFVQKQASSKIFTF